MINASDWDGVCPLPNALPCPFCGEAAEGSRLSRTWWVECSNCGARAECGDHPTAALAHWNRRPTATESATRASLKRRPSFRNELAARLFARRLVAGMGADALRPIAVDAMRAADVFCETVNSQAKEGEQ